MLEKLQQYVEMVRSFLQKECNYTLMLVPHDGERIKKKIIGHSQVKKSAYAVGGVLAAIIVAFATMGLMIHNNNKKAQEMAEFQKNKAEQEQKLQELAKSTEKVQMQLAHLAQIESQVREQMKKSGMEVPEQTAINSANSGKGGSMQATISDMAVLEKQNNNVQKNVDVKTKDWDKLLDAIRDKNYRQEMTPNIWPLDGGYVSSEFGARSNPFDGYSPDRHPGIDIAENYGAPIYATASGYVQRAGWYGGYGRYVKISHDYGYATAYGHMSSIKVSAGSYVEKGQVIGYVGSSGYSTGPHLHYEVLHYGEQVNPRRLLQ